jgi:hypothetical protein
MINMDKREYQELARTILRYRDKGRSWEDSQRMALFIMKRRHGWKP